MSFNLNDHPKRFLKRDMRDDGRDATRRITLWPGFHCQNPGIGGEAAQISRQNGHFGKNNLPIFCFVSSDLRQADGRYTAAAKTNN
ncbi:hypothetical protein QKW60_15755 [Defluviimonas aestuarii]|uniref:hypothetical protein n=1 Tax=Albidovulum aestuarii TaxID=1130726 RepID=UPI00249C9038|nr:hypothetical protein [Defluviimonas aestuarii]MDI3337866.1 hypothetical protein [Defluviimonas aestuarii]